MAGDGEQSEERVSEEEFSERGALEALTDEVELSKILKGARVWSMLIAEGGHQTGTASARSDTVLLRAKGFQAQSVAILLALTPLLQGESHKCA